MADRSAKIQLELLGAQETLRQLREVRQVIEGGQGQAAGGHSTPSAGTVAVPAAPPGVAAPIKGGDLPGRSPNALPQNQAPARAASGESLSEPVYIGGQRMEMADLAPKVQQRLRQEGIVRPAETARPPGPQLRQGMSMDAVRNAYLGGGFNPETEIWRHIDPVGKPWDLIYDVEKRTWFDTGTKNNAWVGPGGSVYTGAMARYGQFMQTRMGFGTQLAATYMGYQAVGLASSFAGGLGQASATGQPFYAQSLVPQAANLGLMGTGAAAGFALGGPVGAMVGGTIGMVSGSIAQSFLEPIVQRDISQAKLETTYRQMGLGRVPGGMTQGLLDWTASQAAKGRPVSSAALARISAITGATTDDPGFFYKAGKFLDEEVGGFLMGVPGFQTASYGVSWAGKALASGTEPERRYDQAAVQHSYDLLQELRRSPASIRALGGIAPIGSEKEKGAVLRANLKSDPMAIIEYATAFPDDRAVQGLAEEAHRTMAHRYSLEGQTGMAQAAAGRAIGTFERRSPHASAEEFTRNLALASAAVEKFASKLVELAALEPDKAKADQMRAQAGEMRDQFRLSSDVTQIGRNSALWAAQDALAMGGAQRGLEAALYGGARDLPWGEVQGALHRRMSNLTREMRERQRTTGLSEADRLGFIEQIEQLRHQADVVIPHQRDEQQFANVIADVQRAGAKDRLKTLPGMGKLPWDQQVGREQDLIIRDAKRSMDALDLRLQDKTLSYPQRAGYEAQRMDAQAAMNVAQEKRDLDVAQAKYQMALERNAESRLAPQLALLRGAGGVEAAQAQLGLLKSSERDLTDAKDYMDVLKSQGYAAGSPAMLEARKGVRVATETLERERLNMANTPVSARLLLEQSNLSVDLARVDAGFGTWGEGRQALAAQIRNVRAQVDEKEAGYKAKRAAAGDAWTEAQDLAARAPINDLRKEMIGLASRYNEGWMDRLISQTYNLPQGANFVTSRFTRYEAAVLGGLEHRSLGGRGEVMDRMRSEQASIDAITGLKTARDEGLDAAGGLFKKPSPTANPDLFAPISRGSKAAKGPDASTEAPQQAPQKIEVVVKVEFVGDAERLLRENSVAIHSLQTGLPMLENKHKPPTG